MLPLIAERRSEIAALCRRFHVRRLTVPTMVGAATSSMLSYVEIVRRTV
jgi:hypothetical protein